MTCKNCGKQTYSEMHVLCEDCAVAAAQSQPRPDNVEVAKPYTVAPEPYENDHGGTVVPDVLGEVVGWRAWRVLHPLEPAKIRLQSLGAGGGVHASIWSPGKVMEAFCASSHEVPNERCSCGFYAAGTLDHLLSMSYHLGFDYEDHRDTLVVGEVAMQGKIIPGTQGWRAQRARPLRVQVLPSRWKVLKPLAAMYPDAEFALGNFLLKRGGRY